ncbi:FxLYD domain-containing protein [Rhodococcus sp. IEGM1300]
MIKAIALALSLFATSALADDITGKVTLTEVHVTNKGLITAVEGVLKNTTGTTLKNVFVTFKLYNTEGEVVGTALNRGQDIEPGESWRFSAPSTVKFEKAKLSKVEMY